jgi:hypothetical protein
MTLGNWAKHRDGNPFHSVLELLNKLVLKCLDSCEELPFKLLITASF